MPLTEEQTKHLKRQLYASVWARDSFQKTSQAAKAYAALGVSEESELQHAFIAGVVATYCRHFIKSDSMGKLPKRFSTFTKEIHSVIHSALLTARNTIYAHTDASSRPYQLTLKISLGTRGFKVGYKTGAPKITSNILPMVADLCEIQAVEADKWTTELINQLYPSIALEAVLKAEMSSETEIQVFWPKR